MRDTPEWFGDYCHRGGGFQLHSQITPLGYLESHLRIICNRDGSKLRDVDDPVVLLGGLYGTETRVLFCSKIPYCLTTLSTVEVETQPKDVSFFVYLNSY